MEEEEFHEMEDRRPEPREEGQEKTSFIDGEPDYEPLINFNVSEKRTAKIVRRMVYRDCEDFFTNILNLEPSASDHEFIDYLTDEGILSIKRNFSESALLNDYSVEYLGGSFESIGQPLQMMRAIF